MLSSQLNNPLDVSGVETEKLREGSNDIRHLTDSPSRHRSLSDASPPILSPSPKIHEPEKRTKDDISIEGPSTPRRPAFTARGLSLQMPPRDLMATSSIHSPTPLSPKLDPSDTYGSPASVLPRRSRGLDFSRAATNLHHSTLAEHPSPESSPTITGRGAMNIPPRRILHGSGDMTNSSSLWSTMTTAERMHMSSSLGSVNMMGSSSDSSSDDDALMDADEIDESILTTPQVQKKMGPFGGPQPSPGSGWMTGPSPAMSSLMSFQKARMRNGKHRHGSSSGSGSSHNSPLSKSPPPLRSIEGATGGYFGKELQNRLRARRESISWAANQLHISGSESDDGNLKNTLESADPSTPGRDGQRGVIRRAVTRRGNMLPKTKGFARIRAALAEEGAPVETEVRREADVIRQVRESDPDLDVPRQSTLAGTFTARSSPSIGAAPDPLEDIPEDDIMAEYSDNQLSSSFKQHALRNSKGKEFWDAFSDEAHRTPPPQSFPQRRSTSGVSDEMRLDSPSVSTPPMPSNASYAFPALEKTHSNTTQRSISPVPSTAQPGQTAAAALTRKVNNGKRRRDDDFDPTSFKRRAVSPGLSVHNSPIMQSPLQRDFNPWNRGGVPNGLSGVGGDKATVPPPPPGNGTGPKRIGFQGMVDTNDGLMKMSIE